MIGELPGGRHVRPSEGCILHCGHLHLGSGFFVLEPLWELVPTRAGLDGLFRLLHSGGWGMETDDGGRSLGTRLRVSLPQELCPPISSWGHDGCRKGGWLTLQGFPADMTCAAQGQVCSRNTVLSHIERWLGAQLCRCDIQIQTPAPPPPHTLCHQDSSLVSWYPIFFRSS